MLVEPRVRHTATLLGDGSVLVIGGMAGTTFGGLPIASVERWDPETMTFTLSEPLAEPRAGHTATLLPDGRVLVAGGDFIDTAELWNPETGSFYAAGSMTDARSGHTATLLPDGRVLVMGGYQEGDDTDRLDRDLGPAGLDDGERRQGLAGAASPRAREWSPGRRAI